MDWRRYASCTVYEAVASESIDRHDWSIAQQTAKLYCLAHTLADDRDDTHSCCLLVHHSYGSLVGNYSRNGRCLRVAWNGYHVETYGAYASHRLKFLYGESAFVDGIYHALVLTDRDERT